MARLLQHLSLSPLDDYAGHQPDTSVSPYSVFSSCVFVSFLRLSLMNISRMVFMPPERGSFLLVSEAWLSHRSTWSHE